MPASNYKQVQTGVYIHVILEGNTKDWYKHCTLASNKIKGTAAPESFNKFTNLLKQNDIASMVIYIYA
jgi:hypothetical protein